MSLCIDASTRSAGVKAGMVVAILVIAYLGLGLYYDTLPSFRSYYKYYIEFCGNKASEMEIHALCPDGTRPISGEIHWYKQVTITYPLLVPALNILEWELPVLFAGLLVYLLSSRAQKTAHVSLDGVPENSSKVCPRYQSN
jgi:hypothetical protein